MKDTYCEAKQSNRRRLEKQILITSNESASWELYRNATIIYSTIQFSSIPQTDNPSKCVWRFPFENHKLEDIKQTYADTGTVIIRNFVEPAVLVDLIRLVQRVRKERTATSISQVCTITML